MMTDAEMSELRVRMEMWKRYADDPTRYVADEVEQLIAEVQRLRTENAALRARVKELETAP